MLYLRVELFSKFSKIISDERSNILRGLLLRVSSSSLPSKSCPFFFGCSSCYVSSLEFSLKFHLEKYKFSTKFVWLVIFLHSCTSLALFFECVFDRWWPYLPNRNRFDLWSMREFISFNFFIFPFLILNFLGSLRSLFHRVFSGLEQNIQTNETRALQAFP